MTLANFLGASLLSTMGIGLSGSSVQPGVPTTGQDLAVLAREIFIHHHEAIEVQGTKFWIPGKRVKPDKVGGYRLKTSQSYSVLIPINVNVPHGSAPKTLTVKVRTGIRGKEGELGSFTFVVDARSRSELVALTIFPSSANTTGEGALWTEVYEEGTKIDWWQTFVEILPPK